MVTMAQRIEELRMARNMSRPALAAALGLPKTAVEKFETGRQTPTQEQQDKLAAFFGVSIFYLRGESSDKTKMEDWMDGAFLDAPAGVDAGFRLTAQFADRFLLVTGAGPAAVRDASRVGDLLELMGKKNIRLIVNRVDKSMLGTVCLTIDDVMDAAGLPLAGIVPEDPHVTLAASFGQSLLRYSPNCKAAKASRRIARRIQGFHEPIALR